jgi:poly(ADP-ribose) glycohydrolase ARH3
MFFLRAMAINLKSKFLGGMIGSALGDAIGELAFSYPEKDLLLSKVVETSPLRFTDDTAMSIGLAEAIIKTGCIDQEHLGKTFSDNFHNEPWRGYASGPPTIFSLVKQTRASYPEAAQSLFGGEGSLGNGAAMRIVPVGLFFHSSADLYKHACDSAQVTHAHPVGMDGAAVLAFAIAGALKLNPQDEFPLEPFIQSLIDFARTPEIRQKMTLVNQYITQDIPADEAAEQLGKTVVVHESMPFAVYSFLRHSHSFEECLFCAALNGGDRDTLGAMACAIAGAYLGIEAIPQDWLEKLENLAYIEKLATSLSNLR